MRLKRYRGRYYAVWTEDGRTKRIALRTADRGEAEQQFADLIACKPSETVGEIYRDYLADLPHRDKDPERAEHAWKALKDTFGALRPNQVTRHLCRQYVAQRRLQRRTDGTIAKELDCLRAALRWQNKNSPAEIEIPPRPDPRDRWLTREEYSRLRTAAKQVGLHIWLFVVLAIATAGRQKAILELTWDRVDFERGEIHLGRKRGGKPRAIVPMNKHARRALSLARNVATCPQVIEWSGHSVKSVKRGFATACKKAELEDVTPHVLRHTAAVWMAERGVDMNVIAQYLGHSDPRITFRVYARYSPGYLIHAAQALE